MSPPQWQQASEIVHAALELPAPERAAYIANVCAGNEPLQQEVEILLRYYTAAESHAPAVQPKPLTTEPLEHWWKPPRQGGKLREPSAKSPAAEFTEAEARTVDPAAQPETGIKRRTTEELPIPNFEQPATRVTPPGNATTELISQLSKGLEPLHREMPTPNPPLVNGQPPAPTSFDQLADRRTAPLNQAAPPGRNEQQPSSSFEVPSVRPVFEQPEQRAQSDPPTYRPIFAHGPKPAPPPLEPPSARPPTPLPVSPPATPPTGLAGANFDQASAWPRPAATTGARQWDGRMLAHYQLQYEIGRGGLGRVYLAQDTRLGRRVALRLLLRQVTRDPERVPRFQQETRAAAALSHPNIPTIYEIGEVKGVHYLATEFVEGRTLRSLLERGRFKIAVAVEIAIQIASALETAHRANLIHGGLKPENLMLRTDGYVKVLDFGLTPLSEPPVAASENSPGGETRPLAAKATGPVEPKSGTAVYRSPEQARGLGVDRRTDVFNLGLVLYEIVTGHSPFNGQTASEATAALLSGEPAPLSQHLSSAPVNVLHGLQRILNRALAKEPDQRYPSAREMAAELKAFKQGLEKGFTTEAPRSSESAVPAPATVVTAVEPVPLPTGQVVSELSSEGLAATVNVTLGETVARPLQQYWRKVLWLTLGGVGLAALLAWAYSYFSRSSAPEDSIAVLPFAFTKTVRGENGEREAVADGLAESLIQRLSQVASLKIIARNSAFRFKGKSQDPHEVGRTLNVRALLKGHLTPRGETLTVTVELVNARDGVILWGHQYDTKAEDLPLLPSSIANRVAGQLGLRLSGTEQQRIARRDTDSAEAYRFYLKGRQLWHQRTGEAISQSIEQFQHAVLLDPNYARAFAALADSYALAPIYSETMPDEAVAAGKDAAARALELDPNLAEPHAALGFIRFQYEWNWAGAEQAFQRALALNENYAIAHYWYSGFLTSLGRTQEAITEAERARELDPLSTPIQLNLGAAFYFARRYTQALEQFQRALELSPNAAEVHAQLGLVYEQQQQYDQALTAFQRARTLADKNVQLKLSYCHALAAAGRSDEARKLLEEIQQNAPPGTVSLYLVAAIYAALDEKEQAISALTQAVALREEKVSGLKVDPLLDPLRGEERFKGLLKNVGFAP